MPILIAAVIVVGTICLMDLLLTFGVIRRLREHTAVLGSPPDRQSPAMGLEEGAAPGAFSAVTTNGGIVDGVAGLRVVAFFTTSCPICAERVAPFAGYLREHRIGQDSVLAIVGAGFDGSPYLDQLTQVARVCLEQEDGALAKAFKVHGFPAFCLLDENGAVIGSAADPALLPEPASV